MSQLICIHEVAPRDGFQAESAFVATTQKVALIDQLSHTGLAKIEVTRGCDVLINVSLSTVFGCPFEGEVAENRAFELIQQLSDIGIQGVTLCDTTGIADPVQVTRVSGEALRRWPGMVFTAHFHNTRGMGLANAMAALHSGIYRFDASLGGLGGCPYAPGASGNICTEDLEHMRHRMG